MCSGVILLSFFLSCPRIFVNGDVMTIMRITATKCNKNTLFGKYQTSGYYKIHLKPCLGKTENSHPKEVLKTLLFPSSKYIELGSRPKALLMSKIRLETWHTPFLFKTQLVQIPTGRVFLFHFIQLPFQELLGKTFILYSLKVS